jgi:ATP-dependent exoDNAse (exonuclease V) alpha subunit
VRIQVKLISSYGEVRNQAGNFPGIQPGERLKLAGRWLHHTKYGLQFQVYSYFSLLPATANAIHRYLSSSLVKGIGPVLASRMMNRFGRTFRSGDRVLQTTNNYENGVFNGDLGWVSRVDMERGNLEVVYDAEDQVCRPISLIWGIPDNIHPVPSLV